MTIDNFNDQEQDIIASIAMMHMDLSKALSEKLNCGNDIGFRLAGYEVCLRNKCKEDCDNCPRVDEMLELLAKHPEEKPTGMLISLADCVIHIREFCAARGLDLDKAIESKIACDKFLQENVSKPLDNW